MAATILSYWGFAQDITAKMRRLSHTTRAYLQKHGDILKAFLVLKPTLQKTAFFGRAKVHQPGKCNYFEWPTMKDLAGVSL